MRLRGPASPYDPSYFLLTGFPRIRRIVAAERPDVLEIHSPYLAALGALRAREGDYGVRTFQWHSDFIDTYAGVAAQKIGRLSGIAFVGTKPLWRLVRSIAKRCDATLVAAKWQVGKLEAHGVPRVVHRPFGIEKSVFRPDARSFEARRDLLALAGRDARDDTTMIAIGIGRFAIEKRWDVVIDAFLRVRTKRDAILVLIGDGPERGRMTARANGNPDVVMTGFVKDRAVLAGMLASADALVHGCPFETFGLSIAEAKACGLPAVVPDEGGAYEMHDADSGETYRSGDPQACAAALERLFDRIANDGPALRAFTANAGARLPDVKEQFEIQIRIYEELLARRRR